MQTRDHDWREQAACLREDPELFFPIGSTGPALDQIEEAKAICRRCPVIEECLEFALRTGQDHGIWGGLTPEERRDLKRRRRRAVTSGELRSSPVPGDRGAAQPRDTRART